MAARPRPYDPDWLVRLAADQHPDKPWLQDALAACRSTVSATRLYVRFVDATDANRPGSPWQFAQGIGLRDPRDGNLVIDVLKGNRIGGFEYYDRLFGAG